MLQSLQTKEVSINLSALMELQPEQLSGGDLQKGCEIEFVPLWFIFLFWNWYSYQGEFVLYKCCTSIWVGNVHYKLSWSWWRAHSLFHKPWPCLCLLRMGSPCIQTRLLVGYSPAQQVRMGQALIILFSPRHKVRCWKFTLISYFSSPPPLYKEMWLL